ncbi:MAG TPA: cell division protein FtsL [Candidatus Thiothrix moscowensis]|uniref:cell division protein FtsL n=1 Tax=unclassified Thiothrix TaxID=2636184 RepID=UPI001A24E8BF|nr:MULTISPECIES: cell division protein FtsL [unclassified Thiothrix]MBJ6609263.1 cell division protein FtsL [Candidatus Thiothrix moscowensis]HRJ51660.1 cell division protein FtsL [Candidatus Thiothrix moscowensis]HRJ91975.1 cell division protein FtsL [Candidatus Thiothrix moscowensis]
MNRGRLLGLGLLYLLVIGMALMVVANRHEARQLFAELQKLEKENAELSAEWSRLKLEQSTLLNQVLVESRAKQELGMQKPSADNIRVIRE